MTTHTDELVRHIIDNAPSKLDEIKQLYDAFVKSAADYALGERYYRNQTDIFNKKVYAFINGSKQEDTDATNEKIPLGMHKVLVDQKVAYLVGEPMTISSESNNGQVAEMVKKLLGKRWNSTMVQLHTNVSNKGVEWLRPYVDEDGKFAYMIAKAEQVIPLYEPLRNKLVGVIYFYSVSENQVKLEHWTSEDVTYYEMLDGKIYLDATQPMNPAPHFTNKDGTEGKEWGRVPFVKFINNPWECSDLVYYKDVLDNLEKHVSTTRDTIIDVPEVTVVLRGYEGQSLSEFNENRRRYKAINVDADGGADAIKTEVPTAASEMMYNILRKSLITAAQGVDPNPDVIGDAPSGVALQHLYGQLDMKASMLEREAELSLSEFMYFVAKYAELSSEYQTFNPDEVSFVYNKMLLTNETELIDNAVKSIGIASKETIRENHPWIRDVALEKQRLDAERDEDLEDDYMLRNNDKDE